MAAATALSWQAWRSHRVAAPAPPRPGEDFEAGVALGHDHRYLASLPYLRRAISDTAHDFMEVHLALGQHLFSATFEQRQRPWPAPAVRSSIERIRMMREALAEMDRAASFPLDSVQLDDLYNRHGGMMQVWGFNWEALNSYRRAQYANPRSAGDAWRAQDFMNTMHEPARAGSHPVTPIP